MELRRETFTSEVLHPAEGFRPVRADVEVRWDPLTGYTTRLVRAGRPLLAPSDFDLQALADKTREGCFFCPEKVEQATPRIPPAVHPEGRIRKGEALLFPNLLTYTQYSAVSIYSPHLHFLPLEKMEARLVAGNLSAQVEYAAAVTRFDAAAQWSSINANHMLPSGSSLFHPHIQSSLDPVPSTMQAMLAAVSRERIEDYVRTERELGERFIADTGSLAWLASFAPMGFHEVRAFMPGLASPAQLRPDQVEELALGIANVLALYAELGCQSFNMAIFGGPADRFTLNLRMVCRSNPDQLYRSDVTYFERLHWQAMVDTSPEELAGAARRRFGG